MAKFKKGDRVIVTKENNGHPVGSKGTVWQDDYTNPFVKWDDEYQNWVVHDGNRASYIDENCIELIDRTIDDVRYGDILSSKHGDVRVLARVDEMVFVSNTPDHNSFSNGYTLNELKKYGFTIRQESMKDVREMTVEEVSKLVGKKVKIVE